MSPLRILIVEDERLIAMQLEDDITDAGHEVVGCAMSSSEAILLAERTRPDLALVDIHLADGPTGVDVVRQLVRLDNVVVFMTSNVKRIPADFAGAAGVLNKPVSSHGLHQALRFIRARMQHEGHGTKPSSLTVAPDWEERWKAASA
ncbi:response regulator [uncultured Enterovirga sp.]|uniref:response regulator n=1 Tax=uncultured Enterovirga sp. TaxID=2026352 RepID=UPI0035C99EF6